MALNFVKKSSPQSHAASDNDAPDSAPKANPSVSAAPKTTVSFMKKGEAAKQKYTQAEAASEERRNDGNRMRRYYISEGKESNITFLNGKIDEDGLLDWPLFDEHKIRVNGEWNNYVCTADKDPSQPCPICEKGDKPSLVGVGTVIDHTPYTVQKGPNAGKVYANQRRLFVAKMHTMKQLQALAKKRGGLAGCNFDVTRVGDKSAGVGSDFDFQHKFKTLSEIADKYGLKPEDVLPADAEHEIRYRTPEELIALGVGKAVVGVGTEKGIGNLSDEL